MKAELIPDKWLRLMSAEDRKSLGKAGLTLVEVFAKEEAKSERELHKMIGNLLRQRSIEFVESRMDKRTTQKRGVPDFLMAIEGQACAIEVKYGNGKLSEEQATMLHKLEISPNKWRVVVIRSVDEMLNFLREFNL